MDSKTENKAKMVSTPSISKVPEKKTKAGIPEAYSSYPSGQIALLKANDISRVVTKNVINTVRLFKVDRLDDDRELKRYPNSFQRTKLGEAQASHWSVIQDDEVVLMDIVRKSKSGTVCDSFVRAGPRDYTVFAPNTVSAAIVTCGGLCPGLNDVIQNIFTTLYYNYGVDNIYGIKSGFRGFWQPEFQPWKRLTPKDIYRINQQGGTFLGSSRGGFDAKKIVDSLELYGVNQVYVIGGDGTHRAANAMCQEVKARKLQIVVAGIPKTIDNDISTIDRSFGFNTAVGHAVKAIESIAVEARCTPNGIGIVQLMGRHAGYISASSTLASNEVDLCLIPEVDFTLDGPNGILQHIEEVILRKGNCVIVVAEGAGEALLSSSSYVDESGNKKNTLPVGFVLKDKIAAYFKKKKVNVGLKFNDPAYMIRSTVANAGDRIYCLGLAQSAVHAAMAGFTNFTAGLVNNRSVILPIAVVTKSSPSYLNPLGRTWERVLSITHQPNNQHARYPETKPVVMTDNAAAELTSRL